MTAELDKEALNVVQLLDKNNLTLATAESCTGGMISAAVTGVSGASEVFGFGVCTYANEAKMKLLGVKKDTLDAVGAVSEETAVQMAQGARRLSGADIAVSVTGIAGPDGGTPDKPVGTVFIGISSVRESFAKKFLFDPDALPDETDKRRSVRLQTALTALKMVSEETEKLIR